MALLRDDKKKFEDKNKNPPLEEDGLLFLSDESIVRIVDDAQNSGVRNIRRRNHQM